MKKLVSLLLIIITAATLSVTASADAIAPEFDVIEIPTAVIEEENETDIIMEIQSEMLVEPEKRTTKKAENPQTNPKEHKTVLYCVIVAVCISLTSGAFIMLIKKKKNS